MCSGEGGTKSHPFYYPMDSIINMFKQSELLPDMTVTKNGPATIFNRGNIHVVEFELCKLTIHYQANLSTGQMKLIRADEITIKIPANLVYYYPVWSKYNLSDSDSSSYTSTFGDTVRIQNFGRTSWSDNNVIITASIGAYISSGYGEVEKIETYDAIFPKIVVYFTVN